MSKANLFKNIYVYIFKFIFFSIHIFCKTFLKLCYFTKKLILLIIFIYYKRNNDKNKKYTNLRNNKLIKFLNTNKFD